MDLLKKILPGIAAAVIVSVLYLAGALSVLEDRLYNFFLGFRINRPRIESVVFLDVDDHAIAYNGTYPWPRSVPADGLLRLKEHGARTAIFDIEYIDMGPQGVDSVYLDFGLLSDFNRAFTDIDSAVQSFVSSINNGWIKGEDIDYFAGALSVYITGEHDELYSKARTIARDNDQYLAQALALFGNAWSTLNLKGVPLEDESQASRRPYAEKHFSYPLIASKDAHRGDLNADILPAYPPFAEAAAGAGFTNIEVDNDGVRRRVFLAQNVLDHWYLQLAFAPLVNYLGSPEIHLEKRKLVIYGAKMPDGNVKDITIPLDPGGLMMLDWPKTDYTNTLTHVSFAKFAALDLIEAKLQLYTSALLNSNLYDFSDYNPSLGRIPLLLGNAERFQDEARIMKKKALENTSDEDFFASIDYRNRSYALLEEILLLNADKAVLALVPMLSEMNPDKALIIQEEAEYIAYLVNALSENLEDWKEVSAEIDEKVRDKFCIIGRVDTGTTDYGANPFWGKYVNVGTHGIVLDTILSESFINPLNKWWHLLFIMLFVPLFTVLSAKFAPVFRSVLGFGVTVLIIGISILLFRYTGVYFGPLGAVFAMLGAIIIREIYSYAGSEKEKQFIRTAFSTYLSGDVVKEIIADPSRLQLGGTKRNMTALFTDVKGFSSISEKLDPEDLVKLLNLYLSVMSDTILAEKGTIDKYEGDAIIAFFGAPLELPDHALRACVSAIIMKRMEKELNKTIENQKLSSTPLYTRIGINTGSMVVGNMGTGNKMNYTIMGNSVNLASRLEGVNKQYGTWILASEETVKETGNVLLTRKLDRVRVVGINEPVRLYELLETVENAGQEQLDFVKVFHEALDYFEQKDWLKATEGFKEASAIRENDQLSRMYYNRSRRFLEDTPPDDWDGVYNLTEK